MKNKLLKLIEKEGFILFLFVCVCVIAGGTLFISMKNMNISKDIGNDDFVILDEDITEKSNIYDEDFHVENIFDAEATSPNLESNLKEGEEAGKNIPEDVAEDSAEDISKDIGEDTVEVISREEDYAEGNENDLEFEQDDQEDVEDSNLVQDVKTILLPVDGPILTEYTSDSLIYSETLEAWVGHGAIDIEAPEGTVVKAAADGTVKEVYEDELWGIVIVIDHGNDLQTKYLGLGTKEMVKVGVNVKKGDHISKVGNTAKIEMLMKPHVHFEVIKNGKLVDPRSINN